MPSHPDPSISTPFGTVFADVMASAHYEDGAWATPRVHDVEPLALHPAAHVLHYGSACFEGLKAHRGVDDTVGIFRLGEHVQRMRHSATVLNLPVPETAALTAMIVEVVSANADQVPTSPGSLYVRPVLVGIDPDIGAVGIPSRAALLYVICSPVSDYFSGGLRPLRIGVETELPRTTPHFGSVKAGANYAMALGVTRLAREQNGVDQVLFAPGGEVQETGASNFMLISDGQVITPRLTGDFLHGVTRDSVLKLAGDLGYRIEERLVTVDEMIDLARGGRCEAALSGTAAVLAPVGTLVHKGEDITVGDGRVGNNTTRLRSALTDIQTGRRPDVHGWLTAVSSR